MFQSTHPCRVRPLSVFNPVIQTLIWGFLRLNIPNVFIYKIFTVYYLNMLYFNLCEYRTDHVLLVSRKF